MRSIAIVALALGIVSCSQPEVSQIIVRIEADPGVVAMTRSLTVFVDGGPNSDVLTRVETITLGGNSYPREIALAPRNDDPTRYYRVVARAQQTPVSDPTDTTFAQAALIGTYIRGETHTVVLRIEDSCIDVPCGETQHCTGASCEPPPDVTPGRLDGGVTDMSMPDMGPPVRCTSDAECDDDIACTNDACTLGACTYEADDSACPAPSNQCQRAVCLLGAGCREEPISGSCDDGNYCNGNDSCDAGVCITDPVDRCPDLMCNEEGEVCTGCTGDGECSNGEVCTDATCVCPGDTELCDSSGDEDCDGLTNCADPDCRDEACGPDGEVCSENNCRCPSTIELCMNGSDDDCDGLVDCEDEDCDGRTCMSGRICIDDSCQDEPMFDGGVAEPDGGPDESDLGVDLGFDDPDFGMDFGAPDSGSPGPDDFGVSFPDGF